MPPALDATVYIVDDDAEVRDALAWLLRSRHLRSESYASAAAFEFALAERSAGQRTCCLLLDVRMPGMNGLALFERMVERGDAQRIPVIFLTGHADVPTAVATVKRGAFDFCEKPFSGNQLVDRVQAALALSAERFAAGRAARELRERIGALTERERAVMDLVLEGLSNRLIAERLEISVRTVEVHRARVFEKMQVKSAVELARLLHDEAP
ncbi:MAG: response regulator [Comamonadaceae bacterium]|nr:response regulator [Comamonadaceae bacterium]